MEFIKVSLLPKINLTHVCKVVRLQLPGSPNELDISELAHHRAVRGDHLQACLQVHHLTQVEVTHGWLSSTLWKTNTSIIFMDFYEALKTTINLHNNLVDLCHESIQELQTDVKGQKCTK